jgi:dihydroxy-acid dehydratase
MAGHVTPEAQHGGPIAAIREGDMIVFDVDSRELNVELSPEEIADRMRDWKPREPRYRRGVFAKYAATVQSASNGAITSFDV